MEVDYMINSRYESISKELDKLINDGHKMYLSMLYVHDCLSIKDRQIIKDKMGGPVDVNDLYQSWYTKAGEAIKILILDRYEDFRVMYKDYKRSNKDITYDNYTMEDYLKGVQITKTFSGEVVVGQKHAIPKFKIQLDILIAAKSKLESSLLNINELLKADLFDGEMETAEELNDKGFYRAAGSIAGVVLEKHLRDVCGNHNLKASKKKPTMVDYQDLLKNNNIIDTPTWRHLQFLADIRNKCAHPGEEPTKDEVLSLINWTKKAIKTLF